MMDAQNTGKMSLRQQVSAMKRVLGYLLRDYKFAFFIVVICILGSALATLRGTLFMQSLIDDYIVPLTQAQTPDFSKLAAALVAVALTYGIGILCAYGYNRIMVNVSQGTMRNLRMELFQHMESLPIRYFDTHAHGDIMSIYTNDVDTLRQLISQSIPQLLNSFVTILTSFISMLVLDIPLTLLTLAMIGIMAFVTSKVAAKSAVYFAKQQRDLGAVNGYIEEMMEGQKVVKVFCHETKSVEQFRRLNQELRESADKANTFSNITMPVNMSLGNISYVLCAVAGAIFALNGYLGLTLGTLVSFLTLNKNSTQPVSQISQQMNSIVMAMAGAQRIFDLMDEKAEVDNGYVELVNVKENPDGSFSETGERTNIWAWKHPHQADGSVTYQKLEGDITFHDVDFGYEEGKVVLHNISLHAAPGRKIAFVGSTGAGKTTITNLLNRFYDIADGKIRYDGININKIQKGALRRSLGMVLQGTHLFTGTVMENIRYGRLDATDEECIAAAKLAHADGFIRRLPDGYQTILTGDGANLSQGQRQLLAIARAAVADPPVLVLDEATSSIDTRTETLVQKGMDGLMVWRTAFVIAHRLSTVKNSDCIMVMEHGRIVESGTHEQLLAGKGRYYQLYTGNAIGC